MIDIYNLLTVISGVMIAAMISANGRLSVQYGALAGAVIVHIVGTLFSFILCVVQKKGITLKYRLPIWLYSGGAIGVLTILFNNLGYGHISVTNIIALGLFGQTITSLIIDCSGGFGMKKHPLKKELLIGLAFSLAGIVYMMDFSDMTVFSAVLLSIGAGVTVVLSRTVNARLSQNIGGMQSSFVNHLTGLLITTVFFLAMFKAIPYTKASETLPLWVYGGGALGVIVVFICNIIVPKVPAFRLTLLTFSGQILAGIFTDWLVGGISLDHSFYGGLLIVLGVIINLRRV